MNWPAGISTQQAIPRPGQGLRMSLPMISALRPFSPRQSFDADRTDFLTQDGGSNEFSPQLSRACAGANAGKQCKHQGDAGPPLPAQDPPGENGRQGGRCNHRPARLVGSGHVRSRGKRWQQRLAQRLIVQRRLHECRCPADPPIRAVPAVALAS